MRYVTIWGAMISISLLVSVPQVIALSETDFQLIGSKYGVSPYLLQAISIIESQEGRLTGKHEVSKVVNMTQHKFLEKIARHAGRELAEFKGSHKGAMGYMQIIPSTFYIYAQDGNGDGIKDPLNDYDSLATAAYFLAIKFAVKENMKAAIKSYNNDSVYYRKVLSFYRELKVKSKVASREIASK